MLITPCILTPVRSTRMLLSARPYNRVSRTRISLRTVAWNRHALAGTRLLSSEAGTATRDTLIHIPRANVYRFGDGNKARPVFKDVEWTVKSGESWAIVGPAGNEKTDLLETLLGYMRITPSPLGGIFPFLTQREPPLNPHDCISRVSFTAQRRSADGAFYDYTARYGAVREDDRLTLRETLFPHMTDAGDKLALDKFAERLDLKHLLDLPFIVLSNGQTRRARVAKALLSKPELLFLDEPLTGLDVNHRPKLLNLLHELHQSQNPYILMALREQDPLPDWITHVAFVEGQYVRTHSRGTYTPILENRTKSAQASSVSKQGEGGSEIVDMKNINIKYADRHVLKNISWTIREGERWHLQGANGSGKTTLLSLLTGDHPLSYAQQHLHLFSKPRRQQPTSTLARLIGCAMPEVAAAFPRRLGARALNVRDAIATGFEGTFAYRPRTPQMDARIDELLMKLGPAQWATSTMGTTKTDSANAGLDAEAKSLTEAFASRAFAELSAGEQSVVLLMRALAGRAPLLVLDEVFAGMDARMIAAAQTYLREELDPKQAVVFVTHWEDEIPWDLRTTRKLRLEDGQAHFI